MHLFCSWQWRIYSIDGKDYRQCETCKKVQRITDTRTFWKFVNAIADYEDVPELPLSSLEKVKGKTLEEIWIMSQHKEINTSYLPQIIREALLTWECSDQGEKIIEEYRANFLFTKYGIKK